MVENNISVKVMKLQRSSVKYFILFGVLMILLVVRVYYGSDVPLSGDEGGVSVLQSVGRWDDYINLLTRNKPTTISEIKQFVSYSESHSLQDVIATMRKDKLHPPLYFSLLHLTIWLFGNGMVALRILSAVISVLSVLTIFLLGKTLYNESVGWISVLFISISPYCLDYSIIVRPYPLLTFLSVFSTYLVVLLLKSGGFNFRRYLLYFYMLISVAGLYTFYSYFFILASQFLFVLIISKKQFKSLFTIGLVYFFILLLFLPWITPLLDGVNDSQVKEQYYKGTYTLLFFLRQLFDTNFFLAKSFLSSSSKPLLEVPILILTGCIAFIFVFGTWKSCKNAYAKAFVLSLFTYFLLTFFSDKILTTRSLVIEKQQFFIVPMFLFLLAAATYFVTKRQGLRLILLALISILLISGFCYRFRNKSYFDGPYYFRQLTREIEKGSVDTRESEVLILYNTDDKRFLLPFIYLFERNFDIMILPKGVDNAILEKTDFNRYKKVFLVNVTVPLRRRKVLNWVEIDKRDVEPFLIKNGFPGNVNTFSYSNIHTVSLYEFSKGPD